MENKIQKADKILIETLKKLIIDWRSMQEKDLNQQRKRMIERMTEIINLIEKGK